MIASQPVDQDIEQAIQRLQKKMQDVSDSLDHGRGKAKSKTKGGRTKQGSARRKFGMLSLLKYLFMILLIGAISFILAQIATGYLDSRQATDSASAGSQQVPDVTQPAPAAGPQAGGDAALPPADGIGQGSTAQPAKFSMQAANYDVIESELGPVLDIAITVANIGGAAGRPEVFEIELVDAQNKQLMKWPMIVSGSAILPQQQMVYKTRLIEPPANFKNIRVTMKK